MVWHKGLLSKIKQLLLHSLFLTLASYFKDRFFQVKHQEAFTAALLVCPKSLFWVQYYTTSSHVISLTYHMSLLQLLQTMLRSYLAAKMRSKQVI
ncbi:jg3548 [Pararge aegeria aegeria]|uniref:Jg3548 protein n=1 Tax=Pararge aegeria aegeria TaxID=348720 RepID=A0A8S4RHX8_9NEOP|nr:jg3548 [Pararge aegeria aegeria]